MVEMKVLETEEAGRGEGPEGSTLTGGERGWD